MTYLADWLEKEAVPMLRTEAEWKMHARCVAALREPIPHQAEEVPSIPLSEITAQILHIKLNGMSLAKFGGEDVEEGRCRELCAMYLAEFIQNYHMGKRLEALDLRNNGPHSP